jgi:integrase
MAKRRFGRVRQLPSGRWQARYAGPDGVDRPAPQTFATKSEAGIWLTLMEAEIRSGDWINPDLGKVAFSDFAATWIEERPGLRPKTRELYRYLLRRHLSTLLGPMPIGDIQPGHVRRWRKILLDSGVSESTAAKAYRLLKTIMTTAADDGAIRRNPCRIKGAGAETPAERTVLSVPQVFALSEAAESRYRALILLATFTSLRWGELAALRRSDIDLESRVISVRRSLTELENGQLAFGPPKTEAGRRAVSFPALLSPVLLSHLSSFCSTGPDALVFTGPAGAPLRRGNFRRRVWLPALAEAKTPAIHFHDLRHTGNTLTAEAGANLRELMARMGHASPRAALIYLHSTDTRQRQIADALGVLAMEQLKRNSRRRAGTDSRSGTQRARRRPSS